MTAPLPQALLLKYQELLRKHETLVRRLEAHNTERVSTWDLSSWGLDATASALALLRGDVLERSNRRWNQLVRDPGSWRRLGSPGHEASLSLREVASQEARALLGPPQEASRVAFYQRLGGEQILELRLEHVRRANKDERILVLALDITERLRTQAELTRAHEALAEREHLRALGEMSSGIVHDLNSTLSAMNLRLQLIDRDTVFAERQRGHLDALARIVNDASTRLRQLREFSRQQPESESGKPVQLADVVREAVDIAQIELEHRSAQQGNTLHLDVQVPPLPLVNGSATDLRYVLINLLLNARDAMPRGGTIHVHGTTAGTQVVLTVADEGTGIPEQHLHSIFRPFFTTKGSQGTGLGLSMAYGVVSRAGGTITAANRPEGGALFTLAFPVLAPQGPARAALAARSPRAPRRSVRRGK